MLPILISLLALLGDRKTYTSSDNITPIVDGWSSPTISLYVDTLAPMKYKAHGIAEYWLAEGKGRTCRCPYCRSFNAKHPPRLGPACAWWRSEGKPRLTRRHTQRQSPLAAWLPLLYFHLDDAIRDDGAMAHMGHNHRVLQRLESAARRSSQRSTHLRQRVADVMDAYHHSPVAPALKAAAAAAWEIADATHVAAAGARPAPAPRRPT